MVFLCMDGTFHWLQILVLINCAVVNILVRVFAENMAAYLFRTNVLLSLFCLSIMHMRSITSLFIAVAHSFCLFCNVRVLWFDMCVFLPFPLVAHFSDLGWICLEWCLPQRMTVNSLLILYLFTAILKQLPLSIKHLAINV